MIEPEPDLQFIFEELTKKVHFQIITIDTQKKNIMQDTLCRLLLITEIINLKN